MNGAYLGLLFIAAPFGVAAFINFDNSRSKYEDEATCRNSRRWGWICTVIAGIHTAPFLFGLWTKAILG